MIAVFKYSSPYLWDAEQEIMDLNYIGMFGSDLTPLPAVFLVVLLFALLILYYILRRKSSIHKVNKVIKCKSLPSRKVCMGVSGLFLYVRITIWGWPI